MRILIRDLQPSTEYGIQLRANNGTQVSEWSRLFYITTIANDNVPKTPVNVTWTVSGDSFMAEWDTVTENFKNEPVVVRKYDVRVTAKGKSYVFGVTASDSERQRWDLLFTQLKSMWGLPPAKEIKFSVRAVLVGASGPLYSPWSAELTANNDAPEPPTNGVAKPIIGGVELSWTESVSTDVIGYNVHVSTDGPDFVMSDLNKVSKVRGDTYTYQTGTFTMHWFKITAEDGYGQVSTPLLIEGEPISPFTWDDTPPEDVQGLTVKRLSPTEAQVSWAPAAPDESLSSYQIAYIRTDDIPISGPHQGEWTLAKWASIPADGPTFYPATLDSPYSEYQFRIRAVDTYANYSAWSTPVILDAEINLPPQKAPTWPDEAIKVSTSADVLEVDWNNVTDTDIRWYELEVDTDNFSDPGYVSTQFIRRYYVANSHITITGLDQGTEYFFRVRAIDLANKEGPWSTTISSFTNITRSDGLVPAVPTGLTLTPGYGMLAVGWTAREIIEEPGALIEPLFYEIFMSTDNLNFVPDKTPETGNFVGQTSANSFIIRWEPDGTRLEYNQTYHVYIRAVDPDGASDPAGPVSGSISKLIGSSDVLDPNAEVILSITANDIQTGTLTAAVVTVGESGEIRSSNYDGSNGWLINQTGITMRSGEINAGVLKGGTINGTTINVGSGGTLNVDDTAQIKSSNYEPGVKGWRLSSSGLEVNGITGSISASNITGGWLQAGAIYVASGGGIYDANGFWSITPSSINISNGSIDAATIKTGSLQSSQTVTYGGTTKPMWFINLNGAAEFSDASVRGRLIVGPVGSTDSSYIQSGNYSPGSQGWKIQANGDAFFNNATVYGTVGAKGSGGSAEIVGSAYGGRPGLRLDQGATGSVSLDSSGTLYMVGGSQLMTLGNGRLQIQGANTLWLNAGSSSTAYIYAGLNQGYPVSFGGAISAGGSVSAGTSISANSSISAGGDVSASGRVFAAGENITLDRSSDGHVVVRGAGTSRSQLKLLGGSNGVQIRNGSDGDFAPIRASAFNVGSSLSEFKDNIEPIEVDACSELKKNGVHRWTWKNEPERTDNIGLIADDMPEWMREGEGYSVTAVLAFLWEGMRQLTDRIEALERPGKKS